MEKVVLDKFVVPQGSREMFLATSRTIQDILKGLPGFVEGFVYEMRKDGGPYNILTTVVWRDEAALDEAKQIVAGKLQLLGLNPAERMRALNVQIERGVYERRSF